MLVFTQVSSMNTRRWGAIRPWWTFHRARLPATSGRVCSSGSTVFFEAQPLGVDEHPHRPRLSLDPPLSQFGDQAPQRERARGDPLAQPLGAITRQRPRLVATDLARGQRTCLTLALGPLGDARRRDPQGRRDLAVGLARRLARHRPFAKIHGVGSRHPRWPPSPAWTLNQTAPDLGIPIPSTRATL